MKVKPPWFSRLLQHLARKWGGLILQCSWAHWIEHGLTSPPTQYRLYGRRLYRSKDPTNSIKVLKEQIVQRQTKHTISRHEHKTASPLVYNNGPSTYYITVWAREGASEICYMRYMRERGVFVLMLYNAVKFILLLSIRYRLQHCHEIK